MEQPLDRVYLRELFATAPRPEIAAGTLLAAALRGKQGCRCLVCRQVIRKLPDGVRRGVVIVHMGPGTLDDDYFGIVRSELCRRRMTKYGIE